LQDFFDTICNIGYFSLQKEAKYLFKYKEKLPTRGVQKMREIYGTFHFRYVHRLSSRLRWKVPVICATKMISPGSAALFPK
jgi:hypothetical protein